jgi:hypothetical protein
MVGIGVRRDAAAEAPRARLGIRVTESPRQCVVGRCGVRSRVCVRVCFRFRVRCGRGTSPRVPSEMWRGCEAMCRGCFYRPDGKPGLL